MVQDSGFRVQVAILGIYTVHNRFPQYSDLNEVPLQQSSVVMTSSTEEFCRAVQTYMSSYHIGAPQEVCVSSFYGDFS